MVDLVGAPHGPKERNFILKRESLFLRGNRVVNSDFVFRFAIYHAGAFMLGLPGRWNKLTLTSAMKKNSFILLASLFLSVSGTYAQSAVDIVQRYIASVGGAEKIKAIRSLRITGKMKQMTMEFPMEQKIVIGKGWYSEIEFQGKKIRQGYYEGAGWSSDALLGTGKPEPMKPAELKQASEKTTLFFGLANYASVGASIELAGKENVEGVETYRIKMKKKDGETTDYFIATTDYALIKSVSPASLGSQKFDLETWYSDFKQVNGVRIPYNRIEKINGQVSNEIIFEKVETNLAIDKSVFAKPG